MEQNNETYPMNILIQSASPGGEVSSLTACYRKVVIIWTYTFLLQFYDISHFAVVFIPSS